VRVLDNLSRPGVEQNLAWLERRHPDLLEVELADVRSRAVLRRAMRGAGAVFHFAAQVAVTTSLDEPVDDFAVNLGATLALLEEARRLTQPPPILFTSTNKVYGCLEDLALRLGENRYEPADAELRERGVGEDRSLRFSTPYGCSKGAADQYVLDYAASYRVPTVVFRMSCIYGPRQFGNEDQGWVAHFLIRALENEPLTIYGDGRQVRDVLFVDDLVEALILASRGAGSLAGQAFNIGGGPANAVSLLEVIEIVEELRGESPELELSEWRQGDQRWYVSRVDRFRALTGWEPAVAPRRGIGRLHDWLLRERSPAQRRVAAAG
jgi:CDP-paratose 2-epimerase